MKRHLPTMAEKISNKPRSRTAVTRSYMFVRPKGDVVRNP